MSLAAHVPSDQVAALSANPEIKVGRYSQPAIHLIALDGRNRVLRNRSFRRGLSYAIDRRTILEETILGHPGDADNAVADGPMPKGCYADASGVKPLGYNPTLATMLIAAAQKELGGTPIELKLEYPAISEAQAAIPFILESIRAVGLPVGLKIEAVEVPESQLESGAPGGTQVRPRVSRAPVRRAGARGGPPALPRLRRPAEPPTRWRRPRAPGSSSCCSSSNCASELASARGLAQQIDRESRDELPVLPALAGGRPLRLEDAAQGPRRSRGPALPGHRIVGDHAVDRQGRVDHQMSINLPSLERETMTASHGPCASVLLTRASSHAFPPLAKGGQGGVDPADVVVPLAHSIVPRVLSLASLSDSLSSRPTPPAPPSQGGENEETKPGGSTRRRGILLTSATGEPPSRDRDRVRRGHVVGHLLPVRRRPGCRFQGREFRPAGNARGPRPEPIDRQPYRIELHLALDPSARIDQARRVNLLRQWQALVHRFVGPPWSVTIAGRPSPLASGNLDSLDAAAFAKFDPAFDKIWLIRISAGVGRPRGSTSVAGSTMRPPGHSAPSSSTGPRSSPMLPGPCSSSPASSSIRRP